MARANQQLDSEIVTTEEWASRPTHLLLLDADDAVPPIRDLVRILDMAAQSSYMTSEATDAIQTVCKHLNEEVEELHALIQYLRGRVE